MDETDQAITDLVLAMLADPELLAQLTFENRGVDANLTNEQKQLARLLGRALQGYRQTRDDVEKHILREWEKASRHDRTLAEVFRLLLAGKTHKALLLAESGKLDALDMALISYSVLMATIDSDNQ